MSGASGQPAGKADAGLEEIWNTVATDLEKAGRRCAMLAGTARARQERARTWLRRCKTAPSPLPMLLAPVRIILTLRITWLDARAAKFEAAGAKFRDFRGDIPDRFTGNGSAERSVTGEPRALPS